MATQAANKVLDLPAGTDQVTRTAYSDQLVRIDEGLAHMIAEQTNTSTTAYTTDAPFQAYSTGMRFMFMPRYSNTGAATLNVNGLGAKKLLNDAAAQLTAAGAIEARMAYWLEYDATLDGGAGAFKAYRQIIDVTTLVDRSTNQTIAGTKTFDDPIACNDTVDPIHGAKWRITPEGGIAVKLINRTGANTVANAAVKVSPDYDNAFALADEFAEAAPTRAACIGAMYESGIANGAEAWVVVSGFLGKVIIQAGQAITRGQFLEPSTTPGEMRPYTDTAGVKQVGPIALQSVANTGAAQTINVIWIMGMA